MTALGFVLVAGLWLVLVVACARAYRWQWSKMDNPDRLGWRRRLRRIIRRWDE